MTRRRLIGAILSAACLASVAPQATAASRTVAYTRGVSYWYVPTARSDVLDLYELDIVQLEDLSTGEVTIDATVVTDRCRLVSDGDAMACGKKRKERHSRTGDLVVAPDLSNGTARVKLGGRMHVVRFRADDRSMGVFDHRRVCSESDVKVVGGFFSNMASAHGRVAGKTLRGPYTNGWDHAWLERGTGTWC